VLELDSFLHNAPTPEHTRATFGATAAWLAERHGARRGAGGLLLDSGCGTGRSTLLLAQQHPDCLVIGVDRSLARLRKDKRDISPGAACAPRGDEGPVQPAFDNALLVRADLPAFWRLAVESGWRLRAHRLLFPNPYPKPAHLPRRWHAHPSWPLVLALGGELELRSNWRTYLEETVIATSAIAHLASSDGEAGDLPPPSCDAAALRPDVRAAARALAAGLRVEQYAASAPFVSEFEAKYEAARLPLFRLALRLG